MNKQIAKQKILVQLEQIQIKINEQVTRQQRTINENTIEIARAAGNIKLVKMLQE